jgi:putative NIF3 family GTP cyclohydrolase 1 type 2
LIFDGVKSIEEGTVLYNAVRSGLTFISSHTCLDKAKGGVNDCLAEVVGIKNIRNSDVDEFLKIGEIEPMTADELAKRIKDTLCGKVTYTDNGKLIRTVALCSGSGGDLVSVAAVEGADALLTGEAKHHEMLDSQTLGVSLFVAGHYETENIVLEHLKTALENEFDGLCVEIFSPAPVKYL